MDINYWVIMSNLIVVFSNRLDKGGKLMEDEALCYHAVLRAWRAFSLNTEAVYNKAADDFIREHRKDDDDNTGTPVPIP